MDYLILLKFLHQNRVLVLVKMFISLQPSLLDRFFSEKKFVIFFQIFKGLRTCGRLSFLSIRYC